VFTKVDTPPRSERVATQPPKKNWRNINAGPAVNGLNRMCKQYERIHSSQLIVLTKNRIKNSKKYIRLPRYLFILVFCTPRQTERSSFAIWSHDETVLLDYLIEITEHSKRYNMSDPIVTLKQGKLLGKKAKTLDGFDYYSFARIPYAEPPVGELRFKVRY
jgi:hypothetical protein